MTGSHTSWRVGAWRYLLQYGRGDRQRGDLNHDSIMLEQQNTRQSSRATRIGAALLVAVYLSAILAVGVWARPINRGMLAGIALFPGAVGIVGGIPLVLRSRPRGIMALFHLVLYPLLAVIFLGLPGAWIASEIARLKF